MKIQLVRNATMRIMYAGKTLLTDPMFSAKGAFRTFAGIAPNPTINLTISTEAITDGIDSVIVSHTHPDHFDEAASDALPKNIPVFVQPSDKNKFSEAGFLYVVPIENSFLWEGIRIYRTGGKHGTGKILKLMGEVSGFVLKAPKEPTVYWAGDSIYCKEVENAINAFKPDIIITHSGGATLPGHKPIIMDAEDTLKVLNKASNAKVVAIHLEALDHCTVSREELRKQAANKEGKLSRLIVPEDGETLTLD